MIVRLWGKWNPQMQLVGVKNGTPRLENRFEVFNEVPLHFPDGSPILFQCICLKAMKALCTHMLVYTCL